MLRKVGSSCSTSDTRRVNLVTNPVISHERGKDREVFILYIKFKIRIQLFSFFYNYVHPVIVCVLVENTSMIASFHFRRET
jgi:hypothetical protein